MSSTPTSPVPPAIPPSTPYVRVAWPPIPLSAETITIGRTDSNSIQIQHASISRQHLKLNRAADGSYDIEDLDSRFGTFVNGARIKRVLLRPGDSIRIGSSPPYRYNASTNTIEVSLDGSGMTISLKDVGIIRDNRTLIQNINLTIPADSFNGVLGPSGAGKSLMLGTLSSTMTPTMGTVEFDDGHPVKDNLDYYRSKIGIVTQDDIVYNDLTVQENLDFAAEIRLPDLSPPERIKRVDFALDAVGLIEHRPKKVGVLSGGQRKRVSVAIELLLQPRLLLLDEPTSGLDPGMQARLMEMLRGLSRRGVTVVCTTHTLDTLNFFDNLLVLGLKDRIASVAYYGSPRELLPSFNVHTQMDLFDKLQTLSSEPAGTATGVASTAAKADDETTTLRKKPKTAIRTPRPPPGKELLMEQAKVVYNRAMLGLKRDKMAVFMALAQPPILALLTTLGGINQPKSIAITFFMVVCAIWLGMTLTVREVVRERKLYIRDRLAGMHPLAYLVGKMAFAGSIVILQSTILWVLVKILGHMFFRNPATRESLSNMSFIMGWLFITLTGLGAAILGLLVSTLSKSERAAVGFLPLILLPQVVLSRPMTGEAKREWNDPSPYLPMSHFITGKPMSGPMQLEIQKYTMEKTLYEYRVLINSRPELAGKLAESGFPVPTVEPQDPRQVANAGALGRGLNFLLSSVMLTRPATASVDMLGDKSKEIGAGTVFIEFFYLLVLISGYGVLLYFTFMKLEKTWNDVRTAN